MWKTPQIRVKTTSHPDQRNSFTMINKSTKESQLDPTVNECVRPNLRWQLCGKR